MNDLEISIGDNAGKVWSVLCGRSTGVTIQELCRQLTLPFEDVMNAIRWLARAYNIGLDHKEGKLMLIGVEPE